VRQAQGFAAAPGGAASTRPRWWSPFQVPHLLAGTSRGYCDHHAAQVAAQPGAVLTGTVGRVPVQQALPGLDGAAQDAPVAGHRPPWGGAR
jgi:hypothetical protein